MECSNVSVGDFTGCCPNITRKVMYLQKDFNTGKITPVYEKFEIKIKPKSRLVFVKGTNQKVWI